MTENPLERVLRLSGAAQETTSEPGDDLRQLAHVTYSCLESAVGAADLKSATDLVLAALASAGELASMLYTRGIGDITLTADADSPLALAVLTTAERKKGSAHTIPGSTDFPIPDKGHLQAAIARYKQGALAGHSKDEVAAHIRSRAKALGVEVNLGAQVDALNVSGWSAILELSAATQGVPMNHPPMRGRHGHAHTVVMVHDHDHDHNGDSVHGRSPDCYGSGAGKAWMHRSGAEDY